MSTLTAIACMRAMYILAHPLPLLEGLLNRTADVQVPVLTRRHTSLLAGIELVSGRPGALFEAAFDHRVHHLLHDLLVGLVLRLDHDRLLLLRGELVGIHFCVAFCVLCCAVL